LTDRPQIQQLEFVQEASDSPVTRHNASYGDNVRELTNIGTYTKRLVVAVVTTNTGFIISRGASPPSSVTTTSTWLWLRPPIILL